MAKPTLIIANKNYSSWSLRPWLLLKKFDIAFDEIRIPLAQENTQQQLNELCPAGKVPVLRQDQLVVWDSLAICEFINDHWLNGKGWPADHIERAKARAVSAEMHSGFAVVREQMSMNCRRSFDDFKPTDACQADIDRIIALWQKCLSESNGPWLFGAFSIADAMFAPVASRLRSYNIAVPEQCARYINHCLSDPAMQQWYQDAAAESEVIEKYEML